MNATNLDNIKEMPYGYWGMPDGTVKMVGQVDDGHLPALYEMGIRSYDDAYDRGMVRVVNLAGGMFQGFSFRSDVVSRETLDTMIKIIRKHYVPHVDSVIHILWQGKEDVTAAPKKFDKDSAAIAFLRSFYR
jgi:hypothetical protein